MHRIDRVNELIKIALSEIISREFEVPSGIFVTVTKVDTSRDLGCTRVFVSVYPKNKFGRIMEFLQKRIYLMQGMLNKRLSMKPLPRIKFIADKTEAEADKIEKILKKI